MSVKPRFDDRALQAVLSPGRAPRSYGREGRIALLGEFSEAALSGREPSRESLLFLAGAISAWLTRGGDLSKDYLRVIVNGSHKTPDRVWKAIQELPLEGELDTESLDTVMPLPSNSE